ncbi:hypothetical protein MAHJHV55_51730 [Mycobacterium avium subsp. hominissuis]
MRGDDEAGAVDDGVDVVVGAVGLPLRRAWPDGTEPFCGVAVRGFPNYFFACGPGSGPQAKK